MWHKRQNALKLAIKAILFLISLAMSFFVFFWYYSLISIFSIDAHRGECEKKTGNNTFLSYKTFVNCSDWANPANLDMHFLHPDEFKALEQNIHFMASDNFGPIDAWFLPASNARSSPGSVQTVIIVHGIRVCKKHFTALVPSVILHRNGFNVLLIDLRNHGKSATAYSSNYITFGSKEHLDVIGAVNYLKKRFGDEHRIGIYGISMGGATALIAAARDDRISAIYLDSTLCLVRETLQDNIRHFFLGMPTVKKYVPQEIINSFSKLILYGMCLLSKVISKEAYACLPLEYDPVIELEKMKNGKNKSFHFDHSRTDILVPVYNTVACSEIIRKREHRHLTVFIQEKLGTAPLDWFSMCKDHTVMCIHQISVSFNNYS
jgi:hypothetical protein